MRSSKTVFWMLVLGVMMLCGSLAQGAGSSISKPTITAGPAVWIQATTATFSFTSPDAGVGFECRLDGGASELCSSPWPYSSLSEGDHFFQLKAILGAQVRRSSWAWTVDFTPPTLPVDLTAEAASPSGTPVIFDATDNLDPAPALGCTVASGSVFALGTTNVACVATDAAGNSSGQGTFAVTIIDTTAPVLAPHGDVLVVQESPAGASVDYELPATIDNGDSAPVVECAPASGGTFPIGSTQVSCSSEDASGNTSSTLQFDVVVQQGDIPASPVVQSDVGTLTRQTSALFTFSVSDSLTAECRLDSSTDTGSFGPCEASGSQAYTGLADGNYLFTLRVTNSIGNVSATTHAWTVDTLPPMELLGLRTRFGNHWIKLLWNKPADVDYSHVAIWRQRPGATDWKRIGTRRASTTFLDEPVSNDVRFEYAIRSFDFAGNRSSAATILGRASRILRPRYGALVSSPPLIDWTSVRSATYFNLQLWREGRKILSVWPSKSAFQLRANWSFGSRQYSLRQARYRVYVWPGFGAKSAVDYGGLLGWTSFTVG